MLQQILLKNPGEGLRETLERHLEEVPYQAPFPLPNFTFG